MSLPCKSGQLAITDVLLDSRLLEVRSTAAQQMRSPILGIEAYMPEIVLPFTAVRLINTKYFYFEIPRKNK
jgi:hypothetical protein